ncbi:MAG: hypothetical protein KDB68_06140 [Planctomycetes bacterium]|nr:hypothetical protein [Planctomycetota bacterium]MCA8935768.1 hypothetical protein [Planctomycetota bacterium]
MDMFLTPTGYTLPDTPFGDMEMTNVARTLIVAVVSALIKAARSQSE